MHATLSRESAVPVRQATEGEWIEPGHVYLAPSDEHLVMAQEHLHLSREPHQDHWRPAIDALFRSAAHVYRSRVIGIVLSGMLHDGTAGLAAIKQHGGIAIVQDPADAQYPAMPRSSLRSVAVDYTVPAKEIAPLFARLMNVTDSAYDPRTPDAAYCAS